MTKRFILKGAKDRTERLQEIKDYLINLPPTDWEVVIRKPTRTSQQNKAMHLFFNFVADALNDKGLYIQRFLKLNAEAEWDVHTVKKHIWRPVQAMKTDKKSTASLTTKELSDIAEIVQRALAIKGVSVAFPSIEGKLNDIEPYEVTDIDN